MFVFLCWANIFDVLPNTLADSLKIMELRVVIHMINNQQSLNNYLKHSSQKKQNNECE